MKPGDMQKYLRPLPEEDDISMWIDATMEERGRTLADLLTLVDAIGNFPPKEDLPVVFPSLRKVKSA
jgi:hypothetical protein